MRIATAVSSAPNRIDIFYIKQGSAGIVPMGHMAWDGSEWQYPGPRGDWIGGSFTAAPAAVVSHVPPPIVSKTANAAEAPDAAHIFHRPPGGWPGRPKESRVLVFGIGTDYAMYFQAYWNGIGPATTDEWSQLGGIFLSAPAAVSWNDGRVDGRVDVFGVGTDRAMYRKVLESETWSPDWERLGGIFTSEASVVTWGPGRLDVFARGSDFTLRHRANDGTNWLTDWENLGGNLASAPTAVTWGPNRLDVFAIGTDGTLIHRWWDGSLWNDWESLVPPDPKSTFVSPPSVVTWGPDRLDVFVVASNSALYHFFWDSETWQGPETLDSPGPTSTLQAPYVAPLPAPLAFTTAPNQIRLVMLSQGAAFPAGHLPPGTLYDRLLDGTTWQPPVALHDAVSLLNRYCFSIDVIRCDKPRSLVSDTDPGQWSITPGQLANGHAFRAVGRRGRYPSKPDSSRHNL